MLVPCIVIHHVFVRITTPLHPEWLWSTLWFDWPLLQKQLINQEKRNRICWCGCAAHFKYVRLWPLQWENRKSLQLREAWHCFVHAGKGMAKGIVKPGNCCSGLNAEQFCFSQGQGMVGGTGHSQVTVGCDCPSVSSSPPYTAPQCYTTVLWTPVCAKHSLDFCCKISPGVAFHTPTRCIQGTVDTLNWKNILKMTSHGTHRPFQAVG